MFLLFKKEFWEPIRRGEKTQTVRFWARRHVRPGTVIHSPHLGRFRIVAVDEIDPAELSDDDARLDGFASADQLHRKLVEMYGTLRPADRRCFKIAFEFLGDGR